MENICIPIGLDAFTLSAKSCDDANLLIAPLTQPAYVGLRLDSSIIQHDILNHADLHNTTPTAFNPRVTDLGSSDAALKKNRLGVYLHWSLPRLYRTGAAADRANYATGPDDPTLLNPNPVFRRVPNRWLIVRKLKSSLPQIPRGFTSWVVESDRLRYLTDIDKENPQLDLESEVSPFVAQSRDPANKNPLNEQTEVFIGNKVPARGYKENKNGASVDLTIMTSSNPLFPDYAPHNANVFSTIDNFEFVDSHGNKDYLQNAEADYFVLGWHSEANDDPLTTTKGKLSDRLYRLLLQLDSKSVADSEKLKRLQDSTDAARILCYSAVYNVQYFRSERTPSAADETAMKFTKGPKMEPLSIGATPLDAVMAFLDAHHHPGEEEAFFGDGAGKLAGQVLALKELMYAAEDDYSSRVRAQDLVFEKNYAAADGGSVWTYGQTTDPGQPPVVPSGDIQDKLAQINEDQTRLDAANRKVALLRWELFAAWWKFVSDQANQNDPSRLKFRRQVKAIRDQIDVLSGLIGKLDGVNGTIATASKGLGKKSAKSPYYTRKDPTLCIAGMDSAWSADYMKPAMVTLDDQQPTDSDKYKAADEVFPIDKSPIPTDSELNKTARRLIAEFISSPIADSKEASQQSGRPGARAWNNANPFVPLFLEYEILYYHIDFKKWEVYDRQLPFNHATSHVRYGIRQDIPPLYSAEENQKDVRSLTGRVILLPQPVFDLAATVKQVTSNLPKGFTFDAQDVTPPPSPPGTQQSLDQQVADLLRGIHELQFISTPLVGLTDHLLTRCPGSHVKPIVRHQGKDLTKGDALDEAVTVANLDFKSNPAGPNENLDKNALMQIGQESALTPYGNLVNFGEDPQSPAPFKGVTHGQMIFKKLAIIDKFGQAIALPSAMPRLRRDVEDVQAIHPCLSDFVAPSTLPAAASSGLPFGNLNTVLKEPDLQKDVNPLCRFIQLGPSINQDTRLNATFVGRRKNNAGKLTWQETSDYDQPAGPVWGWVVINYAESGLQFFLGDGTFYREVRLGGVDGATPSQKWIPFGAPKGGKPDPTLSGAENAQLDALISKLNADYLQSFFDMINGSVTTMPFPPSDYSNYTNSIVGKPLALVNVGWSLELAAPAIKAQNTLGLSSGHEMDDLKAYSFPLKIGDKDRPFDGVVGYWESNNAEGDVSTHFDTCYTYFAPHDSTKTKPFQKIAPSNFHQLHPTYIDPEEETTQSMTEAIALQYYVTAMLIDPYTPLHGYSPILPITKLQVPSWCIESGFQKITAFFRLGPQLVTKDIPTDYDAGTHATPETWSIPPPADAVAAPIRLPVSGKKGLWKWLQPYRVNGETKFNSLDVGEEDTLIRNDRAPYTFVEGYLQLAKPLLTNPQAPAKGG